MIVRRILTVYASVAIFAKGVAVCAAGFQNLGEALDAIKNEPNPMQKSRICSTPNSPGVKTPADLDLVFNRLQQLEKTSISSKSIKSYQDMMTFFGKPEPFAGLVAEVNCLTGSLYLPSTPAFGAQYAALLSREATTLPESLPGMDVFPKPGSEFSSYPPEGASMGPWVKGKATTKLLEQLQSVSNISFLARREATPDDTEIPRLPPPDGCQALQTLKALAKRPDMIGSKAANVMGFCPDSTSIDFLIQKMKRHEMFGMTTMGLGPGIIDPIMKEVDTPGIAPGIKDALASCISSVRSRQALPKLLSLLDHQDFSVQRAAGTAVNMVLKKGDEEILKRMLDHPNQLVQMTAESTLENRLWDQSFVPALEQRLLTSKSRESRATAARILGSRRIMAAKPQLEKAAQDTDPYVQNAAKSAMAQLNEQ